MPIIGISGSHGQGKSSLLRWIAKEYRLPQVDERARHLMETEFLFQELELDLGKFKQFQQKIIDTQDILEQDLRGKHGRNFVVDRPFIDSLAYVKERLIKDRDEDLSYYESYQDFVISRMMTNYDVIFFIRFDPVMRENDGYRNSNFFYMQAIDEILEMKYTRYKDMFSKAMRVIEITTTNFEERKSIVKETLKGYYP